MLVRLRTGLQRRLAQWRSLWLRLIWGMNIADDVRISGKAFLDFTNPKGVYIGQSTLIAPGARILTHDFVGGYHHETKIGSYCFVGANALVLPGVTIGDHCIIAAGAVVNRDVPKGSLVAGNPASVIRSGITTGRFGRTMASIFEAIEIEFVARDTIKARRIAQEETDTQDG